MSTKEKQPQNSKVVLLVDDDPLIIRMYQNKLTNDGYKVNIATNGEEALIEIRKEKPDVILLDVMMPKMNGVETLKELKKDPNTQTTPVIILTNLGDKQEDVEGAKNLGALDYLVKSDVSLKALSKRVKQAVETGT